MNASSFAKRVGSRLVVRMALGAALLLALAACSTLSYAQPAHAADAGFKVSGGTLGVDYSYTDGVLSVTGETPLVVSMAGTAASSTNNRIAVDPGEGRTAHVTIDGVKISNPPKAALLVASGSLELVITGDNSLSSTLFDAGLENGENPLFISGTGSLVAQGGDLGAGIGGGFNDSGANIVISSGTVTAKGGEQAAGIGSGRGVGNGFNITITGGTVTAIGGETGAGIGGGDCNNQPDCANGFNITITGGKVTALGGEEGAGIGGGKPGPGVSGVGSDITIEGGEVTAKGGEWAAGIGGGSTSDGKDIAVKGGTVTATGGSDGAGIGGSMTGDGSSITVSGGTVTATGGEYAPGIGGGSGIDNWWNPEGGVGTNIVIEGGFVTATPGEGAQPIGSGAGALEHPAPFIMGGFFADSEGGWANNEVYGLAPAAGFVVIRNIEAATSGAYPVRVVPQGALELVAGPRLVYDGAAPDASEVVAIAKYGDSDVRDSVTFEYREIAADGWEPGLPEAAGSYRVRARLPEGEDGAGALHAGAVVEGDLVIERAPLALALVGDAAKAYDGTANVPAEHSLGLAVAGGLVDGDDASASADRFAFDGASAGTRAVIASGISLVGVDAGNYAAPAQVSGEVACGIAPAALPYGGNDQRAKSGSRLSDAAPQNGSEAGRIAGTGDAAGAFALAALACAVLAGSVALRARRC